MDADKLIELANKLKAAREGMNNPPSYVGGYYQGYEQSREWGEHCSIMAGIGMHINDVEREIKLYVLGI